jgi:hypothetical protein
MTFATWKGTARTVAVASPPNWNSTQYLESVIKAWNIRQCVVCKKYEMPSENRGVGGIQSGDMGKDATGRDVHVECAHLVWKNRR